MSHVDAEFLYFQMFFSDLSSLKLFISLVYPTFNSIKSVAREEFDVSIDWLKYWTVFGIFTILELVLDPFFITILPSGDFTALTVLKIIFIVWCKAPISNNGSLVIYDKVEMGN